MLAATQEHTQHRPSADAVMRWIDTVWLFISEV